METKKTPNADLSRKSGLFLSIGLFCATGAMLAVFESKQYDGVIAFGVLHKADQFEELIPITDPEIKPPDPPRIILPKLIEADEDEEIDEEIEIVLDPNELATVDFPDIIKVEEPIEVVDPIVSFPEENAEPIDGFSAFYKYVGKNLKYPALAQRMGIHGRVFCEFVVNRDGSLQDVKVIRGIGGGCDEEAARVIKAAPNWKPGKQRGKPVRSKFNLSIVFELN